MSFPAIVNVVPYLVVRVSRPDLSVEKLVSPVLTKYDRGNGICEVGIAPQYRDFSQLNQQTLERLKGELREIEKQEDVKHLIISFYGCHGLDRLELEISDPLEEVDNSWTVKGSEYFVDLLREARTYCRLNGKKLSIIHNEPTLERYGSLKEIPGLVHYDLGDAIRNGHQEFPNYIVNQTDGNGAQNALLPYKVRVFNVLKKT